MPLFDDDHWTEYLRTFPSEPDESISSLVLLEEYLEEIEVNPKNTRILLMTYVDNCSNKQIATALRCGESAVKKLFEGAVEDAKGRTMLLMTLDELKQQPYSVRLFLRHLLAT